MTNTTSALCEHARTILDKYKAGASASLSPDDAHAITALCAAWVNMCENTTLAVQRADNVQTLLAQVREELAQWKDVANERRHEVEERVKFLQGELSRTQAAYHALLSGAA